ncbi:MAG TPA: hypothetical protein VJ385_15550, partial [Fibrobacteria bacterium]|nr:hypothetical protein [Fibrobacteria bacterium]
GGNYFSSMQAIKWILAAYLLGWLGMWSFQKLSGRERIRIPGLTHRTAELGVARRSEREALVSRTAKVSYNLILSHGFPWFLPKSVVSVCKYDNIADNRGLLVLRNDPATLQVTCMGRGEAVLRCLDARWVFACDDAGRLSFRGE